LLIGHKVLEDIVDPKSDEVILKANKKVVPVVMHKLSRMSKSVKVEIDPEGLIGCYLFDEIVDKGTGEVFAKTNQVITEELLGVFFKNGISTLKFFLAITSPIVNRNSPAGR